MDKPCNKILEYLEEEIWWEIEYHWRQVKYKIIHFFNPCQKWIKKYIRYNGWCDKDSLMEDFIRGCIIEFVDTEGCFENTCWDSDEGHRECKKGLISAYRWFKYGVPLAQLDLKNAYDRIPNDNMSIDEESKRMNFKYGIEIYDEVWDVEARILEQNTKYMTWAIVNREWLWT